MCRMSSLQFMHSPSALLSGIRLCVENNGMCIMAASQTNHPPTRRPPWDGSSQQSTDMHSPGLLLWSANKTSLIHPSCWGRYSSSDSHFWLRLRSFLKKQDKGKIWANLATVTDTQTANVFVDLSWEFLWSYAQKHTARTQTSLAAKQLPLKNCFSPVYPQDGFGAALCSTAVVVTNRTHSYFG